jgi:hypothetical protein
MRTVRLLQDINSCNKKQWAQQGEEVQVVKDDGGMILFVERKGNKFSVLREWTDIDNPGQGIAEELPPLPPPPGTGRTILYSQRGKKKK